MKNNLLTIIAIIFFNALFSQTYLIKENEKMISHKISVLNISIDKISIIVYFTSSERCACEQSQIIEISKNYEDEFKYDIDENPENTIKLNLEENKVTSIEVINNEEYNCCSIISGKYYLKEKSEGNDLKTENSPQNSNLTIKEEEINATPENVMNIIFQAAQSGELGLLKFLLPPYDQISGGIPCDEDCKALCNPGNDSMKDELGHNFVSLDGFKQYFSKAKIIGTPTITGEGAKVNFVFGPNLERNETMNMQRINGKWYLNSF